ncbi:hypothetical protein H6A60_13125, partial [Sutterella massiliensis]|nr:hypothetical protein [Sutterella massiliensis]
MSKKMTPDEYSKSINALTAQAHNDGVPYQHVVAQLETTKAMIIGDMITMQRQASM